MFLVLKHPADVQDVFYHGLFSDFLKKGRIRRNKKTLYIYKSKCVKPKEIK